VIAPRITNGRNGVLNGRSRHTGNDRRSSSHSFPLSRLWYERGERDEHGERTGLYARKCPQGFSPVRSPALLLRLLWLLRIPRSKKSFPRAPRRMHLGRRTSTHLECHSVNSVISTEQLRAGNISLCFDLRMCEWIIEDLRSMKLLCIALDCCAQGFSWFNNCWEYLELVAILTLFWLTRKMQLFEFSCVFAKMTNYMYHAEIFL